MAGESSRWYDHNGACVDRIAKKNGDGFKSPTIADACKMRLFPGFSKIKETLANKAVERWKVTQAVKKCMEIRPLANEPLDVYATRIENAMDDDRTAITDAGKDIHGVFHRYWEHRLEDADLNTRARFIEGVSRFEDTYGIERAKARPEASFVSIAEGFGGQADFHVPGYLLADLKTTDLTKFKGEPYYEWKLQLGAYDIGLGPFERYVEIISDRTTGECVFHEWDHAEVQDARASFLHLRDVWYDMNRKYYEWWFEMKKGGAV